MFVLTEISVCRKNRSTCSFRQCCFDIVADVDGDYRCKSVIDWEIVTLCLLKKSRCVEQQVAAFIVSTLWRSFTLFVVVIRQTLPFQPSGRHRRGPRAAVVPSCPAVADRRRRGAGRPGRRARVDGECLERRRAKRWGRPGPRDRRGRWVRSSRHGRKHGPVVDWWNSVRISSMWVPYDTYTHTHTHTQTDTHTESQREIVGLTAEVAAWRSGSVVGLDQRG